MSSSTVSLKPFEIIELKGDPFERGYQYGQICKERITSYVETWFSMYDQYHKISKNKVRSEAREYIPQIEEYSPEIADELKGTAEGSGVNYEDVVMIEAYIELYYQKAFACTSFAATGTATINSETYIGQTNDDCEELWMGGESYCLLKVNRKSGPSVLVYTYVGITGMIGMNSAGIALAVNAINCEQFKTGVPVNVIVREILHQDRMGKAIDAISRADRANSYNYVIGDKNGEIYSVEAAPHDYDPIYVDDIFAHTNHFLSKKIKIEKDLILEADICTLTRYNRIKKLLYQKFGKLDLNALIEITKDHANYPDAICRHSDHNNPPNDQWKTFDSMIMVPAKGEFWIARGNPCQNEYVKYIVT